MRRCASWRTSTSPASRSTRRCRDAPGRAIGSSAASSPAVAGFPAKASSIVRRLSSASACRTAFTVRAYPDSYVTVKVHKRAQPPGHTREPDAGAAPQVTTRIAVAVLATEYLLPKPIQLRRAREPPFGRRGAGDLEHG